LKDFVFALSLSSWLIACTDQVHIELTHINDNSVKEECDLVIKNLQSFYAELEGEDDEELIFRKCINITEVHPQTLSDLTGILSSRIIFNDVPLGSSWTIWVEGFLDSDCKKGESPPLCGNKRNQYISSDVGSIPINISCVAPGKLWPDKMPRSVWTNTEIQSCKHYSGF
jgi:hypothetical protein